MHTGVASTAEVYGFAGWVTSALAYGVYLMWALTPERQLHAIGIHYYPDKHWAVALPVWCLLAFVVSLCIYECCNLLDVKPCTSKLTIQDGSTRWCGDPCDLGAGLSRPGQGMPPLMHLPATFTSQVLYSGKPLTEVLAASKGAEQGKGTT